MRTVGEEPQLPDVRAWHLVDYWFDAGLAQGGMGASALACVEIEAWQRGSGISLTPWEFAMVRAMSIAYANFLPEAADKTCPAPYLGRIDRDAVGKKLRYALQAMTKKRKR